MSLPQKERYLMSMNMRLRKNKIVKEKVIMNLLQKEILKEKLKNFFYGKEYFTLFNARERWLLASGWILGLIEFSSSSKKYEVLGHYNDELMKEFRKQEENNG